MEGRAEDQESHPRRAGSDLLQRWSALSCTRFSGSETRSIAPADTWSGRRSSGRKEEMRCRPKRYRRFRSVSRRREQLESHRRRTTGHESCIEDRSGVATALSSAWEVVSPFHFFVLPSHQTRAVTLDDLAWPHSIVARNYTPTPQKREPGRTACGNDHHPSGQKRGLAAPVVGARAPATSTRNHS